MQKNIYKRRKAVEMVACVISQSILCYYVHDITLKLQNKLMNLFSSLSSSHFNLILDARLKEGANLGIGHLDPRHLDPRHLDPRHME